MIVIFPQILKKIGKYVAEQNQTVYVPRGLMLVDPVERGLRTVSGENLGLYIYNHQDKNLSFYIVYREIFTLILFSPFSPQLSAGKFKDQAYFSVLKNYFSLNTPMSGRIQDRVKLFASDEGRKIINPFNIQPCFYQNENMSFLFNIQPYFYLNLLEYYILEQANRKREFDFQMKE